jgi:hypothetical protein
MGPSRNISLKRAGKKDCEISVIGGCGSYDYVPPTNQLEGGNLHPDLLKLSIDTTATLTKLPIFSEVVHCPCGPAPTAFPASDKQEMLVLILDCPYNTQLRF